MFIREKIGFIIDFIEMYKNAINQTKKINF